MRVVLDSNVLVPASTRPQGQVVTLWVAALSPSVVFYTPQSGHPRSHQRFSAPVQSGGIR
jgi:predicted nucleic acid-binding protein